MLSPIASTIRAAYLILALAVVPSAQAQNADGVLTLSDAIELALDGNPELRGFAYRLRAQQARTDTAGLAPPLELHAQLENFLGSGINRQLDGAEAEFSISRVLELGDKRALRVATSQAGSALLGVEQAAAELDVIAEVTRRFVHVAADQEHLELTGRATALAQETLAATQARVAAARAPEVELRRARITLARAEIDQEHAEHELLSSRRLLAALWSESEARFGRIDADLYRLPVPASFEALLAQLQSNPDFLRFVSQARLRDAEIRLAQSRARSDLAVSAGVRHLQRTHDQGFVVGVTVPLGSAARARGAIEEATALRAASDAERDAHRVQIEAQLFALYQELLHAIAEASSLRSNVVPEMESALAATQTAFERGRYSYLEWVDAQRELIAVQRELIESSADAHLYLAEIERLTGESLSPANP
jgi:cobalt-zinc-cadmium efflux system outer membrane protein